MSSEDLVTRLGERIDVHLGASVVLRHDLHERAEPSHREVGTRRRLAAELRSLDLRNDEHGLLARTGTGGAPIAIRAELDALALDERTGVSWRCGSGAMHACGHDVHMAALVAVLRSCFDLRRELPAPVLGIFQASEEAYPSGAWAIVSAGGLGSVEAVVGCHVHPDLAWGALGLSSGPVNAACDNFVIRVAGSGGHAAYPHRATDPVLTVAQIVAATHALLPRVTDPMRPAAFSIGQIDAGSGPSVIPEAATATGTLRSFDDADRELRRNELRRVAGLVAEAAGCSAEIEITEGEPVLRNDPAIVAQAAAIEGDSVSVTPGFASCGSDDFAFYGQLAPLAMAYVGLAGAPCFRARPLHHPEFLPPDEAVGKTAHSMATLYLAAARAAEEKREE